MREILVATRNKKKLLELKRLLKDIGVKPLSLDKFKGLPEVVEDGATFRANARKKALSASTRTDKLVMADDSGLEVPALGNKPGVHSARFGGHSQDDQKNIAKLLKDMRTFTGRKRRARFRSVVCLSKGKKVIKIVDGKVSGRIIDKQRGHTGFGYDPVFIPDGFDKTFSELGSKVKDKISHRAQALKKSKETILIFFQRYH
ncbi:RdgB/HAM1 family non-canonical purine NTP pyrophosphatase [Candidatus Omnitrophota bacterium]